MVSSRHAIFLVTVFSSPFTACVRDLGPPDEAPPQSTLCVSPAPCASPARLPDRDPTLLASCVRFTDRLAECGTRLDPARCEAYARAPNPAQRALFDCYARAPCGATVDRCAPAATSPSEALGARMNALCGERTFSEDLASFIEYQSRLARPDRVAALRVCEPCADCETLRACVSAWVDAVER